MGRWAAYFIGLMDKDRNWLDWFYYAAPLWLALELFVWPGFRAGAVTGGSAWGNAAFYAAEGGLGAALYFKLPYARAGALLENAALLIVYFKYILFAPLDMALGIESDTGAVQAAASTYAAALPGALYSCVHIIFRIKSEIRRFSGS